MDESMSALPTPPANARPARRQARLEVRFEALTLARLDAVLAVEQSAYPNPWTRGNFTDAIASGYQAQVLMAGEHLLGYFVAMMGVDEVHLLNITVAPAFQRQGWARVLLDALTLWARRRGAQWLWLEVRVSNLRAQHVYQAQGFRCVGERKRYYPAAQGGWREDAMIMSLAL
ncbi:SSU ribosomal protein S18P alanine acetyltransferase [Verminephrobacter eiseniae EF01-2]|uniref:[Ribosomal protein bS18]-alanine N-acetyltransferase n=2 Tax=Verminephrobacter eiseniae TaxID=364317 RepID=A1WRA5_VEREI|nr:SSU ribosomal protein S18P alanine acetyltransferase [Verminephrobacter eiseniae EF01-2]